MEPELATAIFEATVKIEQVSSDGGRAVATGFLVSDMTPDGRPRVTLITAGHVLRDMPRQSVSMGFRIQDAQSNWSARPQSVAIRSADGQPLWVAHPTRDVAALVMENRRDLDERAIPIRHLAVTTTFLEARVEPGFEMLALGYPRGLSANAAGFPILRAGKFASYPVGPSDQNPTFLMDFSVFPGNSGGPVYVLPSKSGQAGPAFIAGILTQQVEIDTEPMGIGIVTHAQFVRETIALLDGRRPTTMAGRDAGTLEGTEALHRRAPDR